MTSASETDSLDILGVSVTDVTHDDAIALVHQKLAEKRFTPFAFLNAHNANIAYDNTAFRENLRKFIVYSDGIGVDIAAKILYGRKFRANLNGTDLVPAVLRGAATPLRVGLLGAKPGVAEKAAAYFRSVDYRHEYRVICHGYLKPAIEKAALDTLTKWQPDILLVAMGVPAQENWICTHLTSKHCTVPIAVGALFDLTTGTVSRAPKWVQAIRCEWVYRLIQEPRRLWRRYLLGNPIFIGNVLAQKFSRGRGPGQTEAAE